MFLPLLAFWQASPKHTLLTKPCTSNQAFIQQCNTWCLSTSSQQGKSYPSKSQFSRSLDHSPHSDSKYPIPRQSHYPKLPWLTSPTHSHHSHFNPSHSHTSHHHTSQPRPSSPPKRDLSTVTCYKCNNLGHYANNCTAIPVHSHPPRPIHSQSTNPTNTSNTLPNHLRPTPVPRTNTRPVRKIDVNISQPDHTSLTHSPTDTLPTPINSFDDDLVTQGIINNIQTPIVIDSGAKISLISDNFINITYEPAKFVFSQVAKSVPVFELPVALPILNGVCQLAVDSGFLLELYFLV